MNASRISRGPFPIVLVVATALIPIRGAGGQDPGGAGGFVEATRLLPDSTAGVVRIPDVPAFCAAWGETNFGKLMDDPLLDPFRAAQRERSRRYFESIDSKVGLKPGDLYDIASGEVVVAWLPFERDKRRPYAMCVIADTRGMKDELDTTLEAIDGDLKAQGATRKDVEHNGTPVRVYARKPKPGQLKIEEIVITADESRVIAADRDSVVFDLLDAIDGDPKGPAIATVEAFRSVTDRSRERLEADIAGMSGEQTEDAAEKADGGDAADGGAGLDDGAVGLEWFARPFQMGRILREVMEVDRGNQVDIVRLLENQGFNAVLAAGGVVGLGVNRYDLLHRGFVLAPPTTADSGRYELAARMLQLPNLPLADIPSWVDSEVATFLRFNWKMEKAFWASETLVNEALGDDEIFQSMIRDIREDEEGPQIDLVEDVLPNLDDQAILVTDNTLPASVDSDRMLVGIRVKDAEVIRQVVRDTMEVEPDVTVIDAVPGVEIWVVDRNRSETDFDDDLFADLGFDEVEAESDPPPPLLEHWAIALVDQGPGSDAPYLMFSSHPELLIRTARRISGEPAAGGTGPEADAGEGLGQMVDELRRLGADEVAVDRVVRLRLSLRVKYELLRRGELQDIDSLGASLLRRFARTPDATGPGSIDGGTLPPVEQIDHYFRPGGSFVESTDDGWTLNGFILR